MLEISISGLCGNQPEGRCGAKADQNIELHRVRKLEEHGGSRCAHYGHNRVQVIIVDGRGHPLECEVPNVRVRKVKVDINRLHACGAQAVGEREVKGAAAGVLVCIRVDEPRLVAPCWHVENVIAVGVRRVESVPSDGDRSVRGCDR